MKLLSSCTLLNLAGTVLADLDFSKWAPPGDGDVRGPCPAMNSLANHGFIPHDGKHLTIPVLVDALGQAFNLSTEMATIVSGIGLATSDTPEKGWFNLTDLNKHNAFEHDASLSRIDFYWSGPEAVGKFNQERFDNYMSHYDGMDYITLEAAAAARYAMVKDSRDRNPTFTYESQHRITSYAETIKFMKTMVDPSNGLCKKEFVKILFEQERLPFNEGWRPPTVQVTGFLMAQSVMEEALVTPEKRLYLGETAPPGTNQTTYDVPTNQQCPRYHARSFFGKT